MLGKKIGSHFLRVSSTGWKTTCQLLLTICDPNKQAQRQRHSVTQDYLDKIELLHQLWFHLSSVLQLPNKSVWRMKRQGPIQGNTHD